MMMLIPLAVGAGLNPTRVAMTADGNSLLAVSVSPEVLPDLAAMAPINDRLVITNVARAGQTFRQMIATATDIDGAWEEGKTNILIVGEATNSIFNPPGRTGAQTIADCIEYINARLALHPWEIIILGTIPRNSYLDPVKTAAQGELDMLEFNAYMKANWAALGVAGYVDMRQAGGPFTFTDTENNNRYATYYTDRTHLNPAGQLIYARFIAEILAPLRF